jgi:hypothetical protein
MLDFLKPLKDADVDCITFVENLDKPGNLRISGQTYNERGESVSNSSLGNIYHIMLFRDSKTDPDKYTDFDHFEAVLISPLEYISGLIPAGWYGIIAKKTTTSNNFVKKTLDMFKEHLYN